MCVLYGGYEARNLNMDIENSFQYAFHNPMRNSVIMRSARVVSTEIGDTVDASAGPPKLIKSLFPRYSKILSGEIIIWKQGCIDLYNVSPAILIWDVFRLDF